MACGNKISNNCGTKNYATCIEYELPVPEYSPLAEEGCLNLEETTSDIYNQITKVKEQTDLSALGNSCLEYVLDEDNKIIVKNALIKYEEEICALKDEVTTLKTTAVCDMDITQCGIDLSGINDQCQEPVTTLGGLLSYLVGQHSL